MRGKGLWGAAIVAALLGGAPGAAMASDGYTVNRNVEIKMSDGVTLRADEYVPDRGCPCTPVLTVTPYSKSENTSTTRLDPQLHPDLMRNGYTQVVVDTRGTGKSGGMWEIFSPREQQDYGELVRWAAKRPYGDGKVLARGESYAAIAALLAAEQPGVEALKGLFIEVPDGDQYRDILTAGGNVNSQFLSIWAYGLVSPPSLLAPLGDGPPDLNAESDHLLGLAQKTVPTSLTLLLGGDSSALPSGLQAASPWDGEYYRSRSPLTNISRIKAPVFMLAGQKDIFQRAQPMLHEALKLPESKKKLVLTPGYHATVATHLDTKDAAGGRIPSGDELANAWFDRWARGKRNGIERFPSLQTYFRGVDRYLPSGSKGPEVRHRRWNLDGTKSGTSKASLFDGSLRAGRVGRHGRARVPYQPFSGVCSQNPTQYLFGALPENACSEDERVNETGAATFTSPAAKSAVALNGPMNLRLWAKTTGQDANVVAKVSVVAPDGSSRQVSFGSLVASNRAVNRRPCRDGAGYDCSLYGGGDIIRPFHPFTKEAQRPVTPGQVFPVDVEVYPFATVLRPGYRLRVSLLTGDFPATLPTTATLRQSAGSVVTFLFDRRHRAYLYGGEVIGKSRRTLLGLPEPGGKRRARLTARIKGKRSTRGRRVIVTGQAPTGAKVAVRLLRSGRSLAVRRVLARGGRYRASFAVKRGGTYRARARAAKGALRLRSASRRIRMR